MRYNKAVLCNSWICIRSYHIVIRLDQVQTCIRWKQHRVYFPSEAQNLYLKTLIGFDQHRCDFPNMVTFPIMHLSLSSHTHQCRPCRSLSRTILAYIRSCACIHREMDPLNSEPENKLSLEMSYRHFWDWWLLCKKTNLPTPLFALSLLSYCLHQLCNAKLVHFHSESLQFNFHLIAPL